jgi:hypothetical protein
MGDGPRFGARRGRGAGGNGATQTATEPRPPGLPVNLEKLLMQQLLSLSLTLPFTLAVVSELGEQRKAVSERESARARLLGG